jgi:GDP-4-dehydro-6-deoxy-D-mannose reductase
MEAGMPGEVYNVCSGTGVTIGDIAQRLIASATVPLEIVQDPELMRPSEVPQLVGDPAKLVAATGWQPEFTLDETLEAVLTEVRSS